MDRIATPSFAAARAAARLLPGLGLTTAIAAAAFALRLLPGLSLLSPMIMATVLGMLLHNLVGMPTAARPGVIFSLRRVLRAGIVLLGFQLMLSQVVEVGALGVCLILATLAATFLFTRWLGARLGVPPALAELIAAGTAICGASAVIATNTVTEGRDEDVAYAVASVTVFGTIAMLLYPLLPGLLHLTPHGFGLWSGSSIHEIAQVVAAAFQDGTEAGDFGTVAKLTRVMMLAPMVILLGVAATRRAVAAEGMGRRKAPPMPWFVLGFVAVMAVNSVAPVPPAAKAVIVPFTSFLLSMALAAMGLETDFRKLKQEGLKPLGLAAAASLFIALFSLALIKLTSYS